MRAIPHVFTRFGHYIGRRGYTLLVLGVFDEIYALSIPGATRFRTPAALWLAHVLPLDTWAAIWAAAGVLLLTGAFMKSDRLAFAVATLLKIMWALVYLIGWIFHDVTRGWAGAVVWTLLASLVLVISTWPEQVWAGHVEERE